MYIIIVIKNTFKMYEKYYSNIYQNKYFNTTKILVSKMYFNLILLNSP